MTEKKHQRRHLSRDERRVLWAAQIAVFVKQYGRKAQKGAEPDDRRQSWEVERRVRHMDPLTLDGLLRDDEDERHGRASLTRAPPIVAPAAWPPFVIDRLSRRAPRTLLRANPYGWPVSADGMGPMMGGTR